MKKVVKLPSAINRNRKLVISPVTEGGVKQGKIEPCITKKMTRNSGEYDAYFVRSEALCVRLENYWKVIYRKMNEPLQSLGV